MGFQVKPFSLAHRISNIIAADTGDFVQMLLKTLQEEDMVCYTSP